MKNGRHGRSSAMYAKKKEKVSKDSIHYCL
jgi:hypothetical protein